MAKNKKTLWYILGILIFLGAMGYIFYKSKYKKRGISVKTTKAKKRTINEIVSASGKVYPVKEVKISSDVSGEIVDLYVEEGDSVVVGQLLAKIDPDSYNSAVERGVAGLNNTKATYANTKAQIQSAKAQKEQIVAQLENARSIHKRNTKLKDEGVISVAEFEKSQSNLRALEANLRAAEASVSSAIESKKGAEFSIKSAEASLKELKTSLQKTTIKSPYDGIISSLSVEKGERVVGTIQMAGTELMRIANLQNMQVQVDVSENDILKTSLNDTVDIEIDAYPDKIFKGHITQIANSASNLGNINSNQVTNFIVEIAIHPNSYKTLISDINPFPFRPGMSAGVDIYTDKKLDVLSIPIQAVTVRDINKNSKEDEDVKEQLEEGVFVMESDTARFVQVESGLQDDEFIEIVSGLDEELIIIKGPYSAISKKLKSGKKVKLTEKKKKK